MVKFGGWVTLLALSSVATPAYADDADAVVVRGNEGGPAVVTVESSGDPVTVAQITDRMTAQGMAGGQAVTVVGIAYRDLCVTPCTFEMKPGLSDLGVHGDGVTGASAQFDLRSGPQKLRVEPGSAGLAIGGWLTTVLGGSAMLTGVVFLIVSDDVMDFPALPLTLIGAGTTGLGIGMMVAGSTSLEKVGNTLVPTEPKLARNTPLVGLHGSF